MKVAYPVIITQGEKDLIVYIPDFKVNTQGDDIPDSIAMARDAIGLVGICILDDGESLPQPSDIEAVRRDAGKGDIVTLVDIDFEEYRKEIEKLETCDF